jgi:hypothetical protein
VVLVVVLRGVRVTVLVTKMTGVVAMVDVVTEVMTDVEVPKVVLILE